MTEAVLNRASFDRAGTYLRDLYDPHPQKKGGDFGKESFDLTTKLLHVNPEFYTIWNYRRHILLKGTFPARYSRYSSP